MSTLLEMEIDELEEKNSIQLFEIHKLKNELKKANDYIKLKHVEVKALENRIEEIERQLP